MKKFFRSLWEGCVAWGEFMNQVRTSRYKNSDFHWY